MGLTCWQEVLWHHTLPMYSQCGAILFSFLHWAPMEGTTKGWEAQELVGSGTGLSAGPWLSPTAKLRRTTESRRCFKIALGQKTVINRSKFSQFSGYRPKLHQHAAIPEVVGKLLSIGCGCWSIYSGSAESPPSEYSVLVRRDSSIHIAWLEEQKKKNELSMAR